MAATPTPLTKMTATAAAAINGWMRLRGDSDRFGLALTAISMVDACVYNALAGLHVYRQLVRCVSNCGSLRSLTAFVMTVVTAIAAVKSPCFLARCRERSIIVVIMAPMMPPATMIPAVASIPVPISVSVAIPISTWRRTIDERWRLIDNLRRRLVIDRRRSLIHGSGNAEINPYACVRRSSTGRTRSRNGYDEQRYFAFHDSLPGWTASPIQRFVLWQGNGSRRGRLHVQPMPLFCNGQ